MNHIQVGQASPNPSFSQAINSVGDNINLFDKDTMVVSAYINSTGVYKTQNTTRSCIVPCHSNSTYTIQKMLSERFRVGYSDTIPSNNATINGIITDVSSKTITITTNNTANYLVIYAWEDGHENMQDVINSIKVEQGSQATGYSPYNMGSVTIDKCNKNLLSAGIKLNGYRNTSNSKFVTHASSVGYYFLTQILPNKITFNATSGNRANVSYYNEIPANNVVATDYTNSNTLPRTVTVNKTYKYVHIQFSYNETNLSNIQVEGGETSTTYITPVSTTYIIPTQAPFRKIGEVPDDFVQINDDWYERHKKGRTLLDGTEEGWATATSSDNFYSARIEINGLNNTNSYTPETTDVISNLFKADTYLNVYNASVNGLARYNGNGEANKRVYFSIDKSYLTYVTSWLAAFKTWLSTHNIEVIYELDEPTLIPCTNEQVAVLEEIISDGTYKNITHYYSKDAIKATIDVTYYQDLEPRLDDIEARLALLE